MNNEPPSVQADASGSLDVVHAPLLLFFREVVIQCGGDPDFLFFRAGLLGQDAATKPISYAELARLLELSAQVLDRPDFGMLLACRQCTGGIEGQLGPAMRHARCFDDVLALAVKHSYAHSLASNTWLHRQASGRWVLLGHDLVHQGIGTARQLMEQILLIGHLKALLLTGGRVRARRVLLRHARLSPPAIYRRYFGCEVRFDQRAYATVFRSQDLSCPIVSADVSALNRDLEEIEKRFPDKQLPISRRVRGAIIHSVEDPLCTGDKVADQLGFHVRSLHRRLALEGTSFRRIKDGVRRDMARYFLEETTLDMRSIAERLGFSEQSVLSRRVRKWFGGSPRDLRARGMVDR